MTWLRSLSLIEWWKCAVTSLSLEISTADVSLLRGEKKESTQALSLVNLLESQRMRIWRKRQ